LKKAAEPRFKKCIFVGDSLKDILAENRAGCRTILVQIGHGKETLKKLFQREIPLALPGSVTIQFIGASGFLMDTHNI
jgi:predicted HAD superfamily phosphohydrolase YqeG